MADDEHLGSLGDLFGRHHHRLRHGRDALNLEQPGAGLRVVGRLPLIQLELPEASTLTAPITSPCVTGKAPENIRRCRGKLRAILGYCLERDHKGPRVGFGSKADVIKK